MRPFWSEGDVSLEQVIGELIRRSWITRLDDGRNALTPLGEAAHAAVAERVSGTRRRLAYGLTQDEYDVTVRTLRRMAQNLEGALAI